MATKVSLSPRHSISCVDVSVFSDPDFNLDDFFSEHRFLSLQRLNGDLQLHLSHILQELRELINKDYEDFLKLTQNLCGLEGIISEFTKPLLEIKEKAQEIKGKYTLEYEEVSRVLTERNGIQDKKGCLQLFLNISDSVNKMEKMLKDIVDDDAQTILIKNGRSKSFSSSMDKQGKIIERVAIEYNHLLFLAGRGRNLPFVINMEERFKSIQVSVQNALKSTLLDCLKAAGEKRISTTVLSRLTQCLRTYALVEKTEEAERIFSEEILIPFLNQAISKNAIIDIDISPATVSKQKLTTMCNNILEYIDSHCVPILNITNNELSGSKYDFLVHSIWVYIAKMLEKNIPVIFMPGIPDVFHANFSIMMKFVSSIEQLSPTKSSLEYLRSRVYNLPKLEFLYFLSVQKRFKEIALDLEDLLLQSVPSDVTTVSSGEKLALPQSNGLMNAILKCYSNDVFISALSSKFFKLNLQLLYRYTSWIELFIATSDANSLKVSSTKLSFSDNTSIDSPFLSNELPLLHLVQTYFDCFQVKEIILSTVVDLMIEKTGIARTLINHEFDPIVSRLLKCREEVGRRIILYLSAKCTETLRSVRSIAMQYRRTNKEAPTKHSAFIESIFIPLKQVFHLHEKLVDQNSKEEWAHRVAENVTLRYGQLLDELLTTLKKTEESLRRLIRGRRANVSQVIDNASDYQKLSDEDKVRLQVELDIIQYKEELRNLGIKVVEWVPLQELDQVFEKGNEQAESSSLDLKSSKPESA